ncbi:formimidoylglutamate deiminase [Xanthomonas massiliensis]|uniref:formimidoylglutamate deiminase n=1 Tax=Xanthomonas massiliensis TaxID=1720302 RepID=UPI0008242B1B|nr:formimidoylglutamate deiminase [Xanthomonas massiliensis]
MSHVHAPQHHFWLERALLPAGWAGGVRLGVAAGHIVSLAAGVAPEPGDERLGTVLPGLGNLHSHAFQRGMAGLAEAGSAGGDSFWSWREVMYRFLDRLGPEQVEAIAAMAYVEMVESGFTRVGEFHYLHHAPDGRPYDDPAELAAAIAAAAHASGIGLTLLPVFYAHAGFGGQAPEPAQRRFLHGLDDFAALLGRCARLLRPLPGAVLGVAPHSLRAVAPEELAVLPGLVDGPVHIHIAEQMREVEACLAWSGQRPVQWLLAHAPVDERWCLVHATHVATGELDGIRARGAVVGLCPITEANLGDGLFPMPTFVHGGGRFGVGSDSNVRIDASGELRLLEYGQRLHLHGRNVLAPAGTSTGTFLHRGAVAGAAQALGVLAGLQPGAPADLVELAGDHPALVQRRDDALLDSWVFCGGTAAIRNVWCGGRRQVADGRHLERGRVAARYARALAHVLQ